MRNCLVLVFLFLFTNVYSEESYKLLIPGETFRNNDQEKSEIFNFKKSGVNHHKWRKKKCYSQAFVNFQRSKLCTHDPHMCSQDFAVEEMSYFRRYKNWLLEIADLCAQGYFITETDSKIIKAPLQKEFDQFVKFIRENSQRIDYSKPPLEIFDMQENGGKEKNRNKSQGAHGAIAKPENIQDKQLIEQKSLDEENKKTKEIEEEQYELNIKMKIIEAEKRILVQKKKIRKLKLDHESDLINAEKKILEEEGIISELKRDLIKKKKSDKK